MNKKLKIFLPFIVAIAIVLGIFIGDKFSRKQFFGENDRKLNTVLNLIATQYVDTVDLNEVVEQSIPKILTNLDPHSSYISAKNFEDVNNELEGCFSGIGITFTVLKDSVIISEVLSGGPSQKIGLMAGDRIVTVNDSSIIGLHQDKIVKKIRGPKNSVVNLGIKRSNSNKLLKFTITRGDIPVHTIDASYMLKDKIGYVKVNKFGKNSYNEFLLSLINLKSQGAEKYIVDLRGNGGGLMEPAILMVNEFLPKNQLIVYTNGRIKANDMQYWSDGTGTFQSDELIVLIDEYSASASEIFAGAIQDNDRGLVIGRRSFGKGLIQQQIEMPDSSAVRLTIGRYHTPSGRCIQKSYKPGDEIEYIKELYNRYEQGEIYNSDSIKVNKNQIFKTLNGRKVYGGGGIIPDIFVPNDTTGITSYYINVVNAGLLHKFSFRYTDINRDAISKMKDYKELMRELPNDDVLLSDFVRFAVQNKVPARWYYINQSRKLIVSQLKSLIARDAFGNEAFYPVFNENDNNLDAALNAFANKNAASPVQLGEKFQDDEQIGDSETSKNTEESAD